MSPAPTSSAAAPVSFQQSLSQSSDDWCDLEQQLVPVHPLVRPLLQREQLLGVEVALVVGSRRPGQHRPVERRLPGLLWGLF
jgi:hypothetical protein